MVIGIIIKGSRRQVDIFSSIWVGQLALLAIKWIDFWLGDDRL